MVAVGHTEYRLENLPPHDILIDIKAIYNKKLFSKEALDVKSSFFVVSGYANFGKAESGFRALLHRIGISVEIFEFQEI